MVKVLLTVMEDRHSLWDLYLETFGPSVNECIQDQICYSEDQFRAAMADTEIVKFIVSKDGKPIGMALATFNLNKARIAYVNPIRLERLYPEHKGRILYFTCLAIHPKFQKRHRIFKEIVRELTIFADNHGAIVAFDYSIEKNRELAEMLVRVARSTQEEGVTKTKTSTYRPLGGQEYGVIELS